MAIEIKFCGLTRPADAALVGPHGGTYAGVVLASGPRRLDAARAALVLDALSPGIKRAAVFGSQSVDEIADLSRRLRLDVAQLHGDPSPATVRDLRDALQSPTNVWAVVRVSNGEDAARAIAELDGVADGILLDAAHAGTLGGSGTVFDWSALPVGARPEQSTFIVAGGLTPDNVAHAIRTFQPDVVDVSSGIERARGIKDPERMRDFARAVLLETQRA
ncbi:MAG TPA: phosphoribosylanthranilate isomerase [Gemmatimonadaceae bacterium]|nr:phosphoribosylanthranilate isomerase [Gemmatimonadaceae bacterium]